MNRSNNIKHVNNKDVSKIYQIFEEIYLKAPTFLKDLSNNSVGIDNTESIREQIDFKKIDTKFKNGEYCFITDAIKDIRTVFLNCYSFYGARSNHTKQSLELEELLEEKISYLDKNYKLLADVNLTFKLLNMEGKPSSKLRYPKDCYDSVLLRSVAHCRPERLKKYHKTLSTTLTTDKDNAHILEKILSWENKVNFDNVFHQYISSMWELPEIGNFLAILFKKLDLDIIKQGEIERMFLMPKESTIMGKVMTTLLMPVKKTKCIGQVMPYKVWSEKLSMKVSDWCKVYHTKNQNKVIAMNLLGIHPDFWSVVNEKNPLIEKDYNELSYFIKVWLVKGLCDYVTIKFKTINDIVTNCNARQCTIWKNDLETEEYFFFDSMPDLRIYYYNIPYDEPCLKFLDSVKTDNELTQFKDILTMDGFSEGFHTVQKEKHFKLIADSVESLRAFVYELDMGGTSVPESLITSLEKFIVNIEPEEYNYILMNNDSKIKLFKDLESYSDRIQKDKNNISVWEEKDSKSNAKTKNEELIIAEKRQRKLIVHQNFDLNESDEYVNENDNSLSDFTDSEDEWGVMNRHKFKVKQPQKTPSKLLLELEKRVSKANKMLKGNTNNLLDTNQSDESNQHNRTLVSSNNLSLLKEKDTKSIDQAKNEELIIADKRQRKLIVHQNVDLNESDEYVSENDNSLSDFTDSEDEWGVMNRHKFKVKQLQKTPPKLLLELEKPVSKANKMLKGNTNKLLDTNQSDESNQLNKTLVSPKNLSLLEEKDSRSIDQAKNEELIIAEKRQRKLIVHQNFDLNESDEYVNENDKSLSDFTDSEDEWGVMNRHKFKVKQSQKTPSKLLLELEKRVSKANKMLKGNTNNLLDTNQSDESNQHNRTLVSSKNLSLLKEKDSKSIDQAQYKGIISQKHLRKLVGRQDFETGKYYENDESSSDLTDSKDEWVAMKQSKNKVKQPRQILSKHLELETRLSKDGKMLKYDTNQSDVKQLRDEDNISKRSTHKMCKTNNKYKSIKSVKLMKTENEVKICSNNTNTLPLVNANNEVKQPLQTPPKRIKLEKQLREENTILKHKSIKVFDKKDKYIKSVKLLKSQNEVRCSDNTNTLPLVNANNKVKQPLQTPPKRIKLEKRLREENTILKHKSIKVFDKKDKYIKSVKLLKSQNEVKCSNNTDTFVNGYNQRLVRTKNKDIVSSYEEVVLINSDKEVSQKTPEGLRLGEIITLDEGMQNDCEVFNDNFESSISTCTENKNRKSNEQNNYKQIESAVISIEDDDQTTIISDDEDAVQFISMTEKPKCSPLKNNKPCSLKTNLNKSYNSVSANRRITPTNYIKHKAKSSIIHKLSQNVTILPANVNIPKGIQVTMVKNPQTKIDSNFNSIKRKSTVLNGHPPDNPSTINVKCELISKPNLNGEVKFYVRLPNGKEHPGPNELINQYLKQHNNQLPDYWLVPLPVEVAKQYGFN